MSEKYKSLVNTFVLDKLKALETQQDWIFFPFYKHGSVLENAPACGMTLWAAGSMRFRWNETNDNRNIKLESLAESLGKSKLDITPVELIHSKIVYDVHSSNDTFQKNGDGIITKNMQLMPVVTVADCVPIYLYDSISQVFGIVHSGWKGTGIVSEAITLAEKKYGAKPEDFSVIIGPHIKKCCYIVNQERAEYFTENFGSDCITPLKDGENCYCGGKGLPIVWNNGGGKLYRLSLEQANLNVLQKLGVRPENILLCEDCTCCNEVFGSNRRETAYGKEFTVQAAFITKK
ncbi:MAG: polyphenol oxidase family protein [Treponema sp.]|nr:polyphenol oxidase family protein [Treponema sp.]